MGIGPEQFDPNEPVSPSNTPSPWKANPEQAKIDGRKGGLAKKNRSELTKALHQLRRDQLKIYEHKLEKRLSKFDRILDRVQKELLTPRMEEITLPDGSVVSREAPLSEGKLELLLKYHRQLHEIVIGKPSQKMEVSGKGPVTVIINEEPEPIDVTPESVEITTTSEQLQITEE
jgi:hypothetical protein